MKAGENTGHVVLLPTTEQDAALEELGHWDLVEEKQAEVGGCEELEHWDLVEEKQAQVGGCDEVQKDHHLDVIALLLLQRL